MVPVLRPFAATFAPDIPMRFAFLPLLLLVLAPNPVWAQSVLDNLPGMDNAPASDNAATTPQPTLAKQTPTTLTNEICTVADVNADVTADNANHARDQALMQAERAGLSQLMGKLGAPDNTAKMKDDDVALLVQSFEVQSEKTSATRYIGVFTIRFKPSAVQKKFGKAIAASTTAVADGLAPDKPDAVKPLPTGPVSHIMVAVRADSLPTWGKIKTRIQAAQPVVMVEVLDLARGVSHIDLSYGGTLPDLQNALTDQGLVLRQNNIGVWEIYDGSMTAR